MTDDAGDNDARAAVAELQELLLNTEDIQEFLQHLAVIAATGLGSDISCGVTLRRNGRPMTVASSDDRAARVDEVQYGHEQGPCLSSSCTGEVNLIDDLAEDDRWTAYRIAALAHGIRASLSIPLRRADQPIGALNLYSGRPRAFGPAEQASAGRFAGEIARVVALAMRLAEQADLSRDLTAALASRSTIDQALGVIMGQNRCTADEAFTVLRTASQHRNTKLRDIAADIVTAITGSPPQPTPFAGHHRSQARSR